MAEAHNDGSGLLFTTARETAADLTTADIEEILKPRWEGGWRFLVAFEDLLISPDTNEKMSQYLREKICGAVDDPETAEKLVPTDHYYATKRPPPHTNYYDTFNRGNVSLVDVTETPVDRFTTNGIRTGDGEEHEFDIVVFATGFDAMTETLLRMDIEGRDGLTLEEKWGDGPQTYLGLGVHGFPNMFTITGPQSPSALSNMPVPIENHVEWVSETIGDLVGEGTPYIEPTRTAEEDWTEHNMDLAQETLYTTVDSWYMNENIPGKPTVFVPYPGGVDVYQDTIREVRQKGYEGYTLADSVDGLGRRGESPQLGVFEAMELLHADPDMDLADLLEMA